MAFASRGASSSRTRQAGAAGRVHGSGLGDEIADHDSRLKASLACGGLPGGLHVSQGGVEENLAYVFQNLLGEWAMR